MLGRISLILLVLGLCLFLDAVARPPVVLVPGLLGSVLEAKLDNASKPRWYCETTRGWHKVWVALWETLKLSCLNYKLVVGLGAESGEYMNSPGVQIRPRDFGGAGGIAYIASNSWLNMYDEFETIIKSFIDIGYVVGRDLHGAPYDWRLAGDGHARKTALGVGGFYDDLKALIERAVSANGARATVVAHSLGCPTMHYFFHTHVNRSWLNAYVARFVPMAGPWAGGVFSVELLISGDPGAPLLPQDIWKPVQSNIPSTVWMLPLPSAFDGRVVLRNETHSFAAADRAAMLNVAGTMHGMRFLTNQQQSGADLQNWQRFVPGLPVHFVISSGVATPISFEYRGPFFSGYKRPPVHVEQGDGDGTVNHESLTAFERWPVEPTAKFAVHRFRGRKHSDLLYDERVIHLLHELVLSSVSELSVVWV